MKVIEQEGKTMLADDEGHIYKVVPRWQNDFANALVKIGRGRGGTSARVNTEADWRVVEDIVRLYAKAFPTTWREFLRSNRIIRQNQRTEFGLLGDRETKKGGEAQIRQLGQWPFDLERFIKVIYPNQPFDKRFIREFMRRLPAFRTSVRI